MSKQDLYLQGYGKGLPIEDRITRTLRLAARFRAERLLDIGCGDGSISLALKGALGASEVYGVEISPEGASEARSRGVACHQLDIDQEPLPFADGFFDAVTALEVMEHVYDPDHLLQEIFRVLAPDGCAIIETPNLGWWADRLSLLMGFQPQSTEASLSFGSAGKMFSSQIPGGGGHLRILTVRAFKQLLGGHGFKVCQLMGAGGKSSPAAIPGLLRPAYRSLNGLFCRFPASAQFMTAVVRKQPQIS